MFKISSSMVPKCWMSLNTTLQLGYIRIVLCYYYHDYLLSVLLDLPEAISTKYECNIYYCFTLRKEGNMQDYRYTLWTRQHLPLTTLVWWFLVSDEWNVETRGRLVTFSWSTGVVCRSPQTRWGSGPSAILCPTSQCCDFVKSLLEPYFHIPSCLFEPFMHCCMAMNDSSTSHYRQVTGGQHLFFNLKSLD